MRWVSLKDLKESLSVQADSDEPDAIRAEIRKQLALIHPDKNNGQFVSPEAKDRFNLLTAALDYIDEYVKSSQALIPVNQLTEIVRAVNMALAPSREERALSTKSEIRSNFKEEISSSYSFPRISSGAFAAICGSLIVFQENFRNISIIGNLFRDPLSELFIVMLFIGFGIFFLLTWIFERHDEARDEWLLSEAGRKFLFREMLQRKILGRKEGSPIILSLNDWIDEIKLLSRARTRLPLYFRRMSEALAETIAKLHIDELEQRKIIKRIETPRLDPIYEVNEEVINNL